ncbi:MAG: small ribosomal subunit Rsm22 family protein [Treponema lecithinolyticum]|uniref:small ribosomal subunit Rsm22 family protein n=1 Tax=Treponema lecithinolyticum TaxID=53418 RepID=UPI003FA2423A
MNVFAPLPQDARRILEEFGSIVQTIQPLSAKQLELLPRSIRELSHLLTDERSRRKGSYMNSAPLLSAYIRYFMWWNLYRLVSLFTATEQTAFGFLYDGSVCLDIGSGPLTVPLALFLARKELRGKKLIWYCMDSGSSALALGERLFYACCERLNAGTSAPCPWRIVRVKGQAGTAIKSKADLITCANVFNEAYWSSKMPLKAEAQKDVRLLLSYAGLSDTDSGTYANGKDNRTVPGKRCCAVFVAEPGIPRSARFVGLLRDELIRKKMHIVSPCTHENECPMNKPSCSKWCHFVLNTKTAPQALQRLSDKVLLPKDRASLSFVFASSVMPAPCTAVDSVVQRAEADGVRRRAAHTASAAPALMRVCSDTIALPEKKAGCYACAPWGLTLLAQKDLSETSNKNIRSLKSGDSVPIKVCVQDVKNMAKDRKSGAKIYLV